MKIITMITILILLIGCTTTGQNQNTLKSSDLSSPDKKTKANGKVFIVKY